MKRILAICIALVAAAALIFGAVLIYNGSKENVKMVDGQYKLQVGTAVTLATEEAKSTVTTVAVITDGSGKIVDCVIDCGDFGISADDVKASKSGSYLTKNELGDDYGMVAYAKAKYEWYKQAENFANSVKGMSSADVTMLKLGEDGKATDADILAGCTIAIGDFKAALVKAMGDTLAVSFESEETPVLSLAMTNKDSIGEAGETFPVSMVTDICAVATVNGKVKAAIADVCESKFEYAADGSLASADFGGTKREKLEGYGMVAYAGAKYEWYEQAYNFCNYIKGMTAEEVAAIEMDKTGKAQDADLSSGCTIAVGDLVKIASKALGAE